MSVWADALGIEDIDPIDLPGALETLARVKDELLPVIQQKEAQPFQAVDLTPFHKALESLNRLRLR